MYKICIQVLCRLTGYYKKENYYESNCIIDKSTLIKELLSLDQNIPYDHYESKRTYIFYDNDQKKHFIM